MRDTLIKPLITELSIAEAKVGKYTFHVTRHADKKNIKNAIEDRFKVHVTKIATNVVKGRTKRTGAKRTEKVLSAWKKARVTLKKDEKIDLFDIGGAK